MRPVGMLRMEDESGGDEKIRAVPIGSDAFYADIHSLEELPSALRAQIDHFFGHYKDLDRGKWGSCPAGAVHPKPPTSS
jgi:inorganic pyrophosphatase